MNASSLLRLLGSEQSPLGQHIRAIIAEQGKTMEDVQIFTIRDFLYLSNRHETGGWFLLGPVVGAPIRVYELNFGDVQRRFCWHRERQECLSFVEARQEIDLLRLLALEDLRWWMEEGAPV